MSDLLTLMGKGGDALKPVRMLSYTHVKAGKLNEKPVSSFTVGFKTGDESFAVTIDDGRCIRCSAKAMS